MGGYTHKDGSEDTWDDLLTSNRCFAVVLGKLLQEKEGMFVELEYQEKFPDDTYGKFVVYKNNGCIEVGKADDEIEFENGLMVWMHEGEK